MKKLMNSFVSACVEFLIILIAVVLVIFLFPFVAEEYEMKDDFEDFV